MTTVQRGLSAGRPVPDAPARSASPRRSRIDHRDVQPLARQGGRHRQPREPPPGNQHIVLHAHRDLVCIRVGPKWQAPWGQITGLRGAGERRGGKWGGAGRRGFASSIAPRAALLPPHPPVALTWKATPSGQEARPRAEVFWRAMPDHDQGRGGTRPSKS